MATMHGLAALAAGLSDDLAEVGRRLTWSVAEVRTNGHGAGAGTVWSADGLIVTNHHVAPGERAEVTLADGRTVPATAVARDRDNDLAALRVQAGGLTPATVGDARTLRPGELVIAVGHPFGVRQALTVGVVTATPAQSPGPGERELVRAGVMLRPGNSGGPLADARGRVVGINAMVAGGLALAVPSHLVERLVGAHGRRRTLGIQGRDVQLPPVYAAAAGYGTGSAVLVGGVAPGSAAEAAGLLPGDLLLALDGTPVKDVDGLRRLLGTSGDGMAALRILRGGRLLELPLNFGPATEQRAA